MVDIFITAALNQFLTNWLDKKRAVTSMTRAAENIKAQEERVVRANEQKENDELASRLYVLNRAQLKL